MFIKPKRTVRRVFLHHSATDNKKHDNVAFIRRVHVKENGWSDIGYHFYITKDGVVHECRPLFRKPAAQKGNNSATIAICLSGRNEFTEAQRASLEILCEQINTAYDTISFHGHKEVAATECPNYDYKAWLKLDSEGHMLPKIFTEPKRLTAWQRFLNWLDKLGE